MRETVKKNKSSLVYKIAYGLNKRENRPEKTTRCRLFWKTVFMLFLGWPAGGLLLAITLAVGLVAITIIGCIEFTFSRRPTWYEKEKGSRDMFTPIEKWPTIRGHRVWPISVFILVFAAFQLGPFFRNFPGCYTRAVQWLNQLAVFEYYTFEIAVFFAVFFLAAVLYLGIRTFRKSEFYGLLKGYLSDIEKNWCPIVEFVDDENKIREPSSE